MPISFYPLYIDPGTGSALFSIIIGIAATVYFVGQALVIKLKVVVAGGKKAGRAKRQFVIYAEDKRYWTLFKPVLEEFEKRQTEVCYLTSSEDDPVFESGLAWTKPEYIGSGNKAYAHLNFLSAGVVLATTPGLDVFQWKRSKGVGHYAHILHAATDAVFYRLFGLDYYDSVLLTGDYQAEDIRALEKLRNLPPKEIVTVGCPYLDAAAEALKNLKKNGQEFTVLVSPSWGASSLLVRYGEKLLDPLAASPFHIIIRPHPQSKISENEVLARLTERYKNVHNIEWDYSPNNTASLSKADIMISDFSGIIFDYMFLFDKPFIYVDYDFDIRPYDVGFLDGKNFWQMETIKKTGIELKPEDFKNIAEIIKRTADDEQLKAAREEAAKTAWMYRNEAGKRTAEFLINTVQRIEAEKAE